jgi:tetratricopeptide (TPR) repeat protein
MKGWTVALFCLTLAGCASTPPSSAPAGLFNDRLFQPPSERINAEDVFALSAEMKTYLSVDIAPLLHFHGTRQGLVAALTTPGLLKLEYESTRTRNAAQAFSARSGNCLSLVIMTAAFAKGLDLPVRFQSVTAEETLSRSGDIQFIIGHVNVTLGDRIATVGAHRSDNLTVDFIPTQGAARASTRQIAEETVVAMFMNNRSAEALAAGRFDEAYWWARAAIGQDPKFLSAYNTLGVVYRRHGDLPDAERVFAHVLERDPQNTHVMSNLVPVLEAMGRRTEAATLARRLEQLDPHPPFSYFMLGMNALRERNFVQARDLFAKEVDRAPYYHEFHFWLAQSYLALGDIDKAKKQLALALEYSESGRDRELYAAKLARIKSLQIH